MSFDAIVVGGGVAGLTASSYLARAGLRVGLLEKEERVGGLVNSFERGGFVFDGGIRAMEDSGIVRSMLRQLGIELEFLANPVSIGFGRDVVRLSSKSSLLDYQAQVNRQFPGAEADVARIIAEVRRVMGYMDVLYGIDNPLFVDIAKDPGFVFRTILPWLAKYIPTMPKIAKLDLPVYEYLAGLTANRALIDMFAQHFFKKTPTFFALSYFSLYLDYDYPRGGTGALTEALRSYLAGKGGEIATGVEVVRLDPEARSVVDSKGRDYSYGRLIWAADAKALYRATDEGGMRDRRAASRVADRRREIADKVGGDSVFTLYLSSRLEPSYFAGIASAHFFYTPRTEGLSSLGPMPALEERTAALEWLGRFLDLNTFEISFPALRDPALAPAGQTGLIVSVLMDHSLVARAEALGWYAELRDFCAARIVRILDRSIFTGLEDSLIDSFTSTPLTIARRTGNADGAITGWAFTNDRIPAVDSIPRVAKSSLTPIPGVYQAGQWSYSPSGLPISILTGKLAADRVVKDLRRRGR